MEDVQKILKLFPAAGSEQRPWGVFFCIDSKFTQKFAERFFPHFEISNQLASPKLLIVYPGKRLSWQYHRRREELWNVVSETAGVVAGFSDEEPGMRTCSFGERMVIACGERHRLIAFEKPVIVAELWVHTDSKNPSDEKDIVRLQDDFGR